MPAHLHTREFFELARSRLAQSGGTLYMNLIVPPRPDRLMVRIDRTLRSACTRCEAHAVGDASQWHNRVYVCARDPLDGDRTASRGANSTRWRGTGDAVGERETGSAGVDQCAPAVGRTGCAQAFHAQHRAFPGRGSCPAPGRRRRRRRGGGEPVVEGGFRVRPGEVRRRRAGTPDWADVEARRIALGSDPAAGGPDRPVRRGVRVAMGVGRCAEPGRARRGSWRKSAQLAGARIAARALPGRLIDRWAHRFGSFLALWHLKGWCVN